MTVVGSPTPLAHGADRPKVSVLMITYNHEKVIAQAVTSALTQETSFDYEIVIGEDCSTDGTRAFLLDFQRQHPDRIRLLLHEKNLGLFGKYNLVQTLAACRGQYVAVLEGDDYWTSPQKLQKQAEFLDRHPECSTCFHNALVVNDTGAGPPPRYFDPDQPPFVSLPDLLRHGFPPLASVMFRRGLFGEFPAWFFQVHMSDWPLYVLNAQHGSFGYLPATMSAYRVHTGGSWTTRTLAERSFAEIQAYQLIDEHLHHQYTDILSRCINGRVFFLATAYDEEANPAKGRYYFKQYLANHWRHPAISARRIFRLFLRLYCPRLFVVLKRIIDRLRGRCG